MGGGVVWFIDLDGLGFVGVVVLLFAACCLGGYVCLFFWGFLLVCFLIGVVFVVCF